MTVNPYGGGPGGKPAEGPGAAGPTSNPYLQDEPRHVEPDLDAAAHDLRSEATRRLNRKALVFLAGILALAVVALVWTFNRAIGGREAPPPRLRAAEAVIPALPDLAPPPEPLARPVPIAAPTLPPLPPLPPEFPAYVEGGEGSAPYAPPPLSLRQRRMGATGEAGEAPARDPASAAPGITPGPSPAVDAVPAEAERLQARTIGNPDALLPRGTYIRCLLQSRIVTDIPGFTACVVTEPVYSINARRLLLPRGSRVLGRYGGEPSGPRVAVVWDRIITPAGVDIAMSSPGVDGLGSAGHPGDYDAHWGSRIASALLISLISDAFKYAAAEQGPRTTTVGNGFVVQDPYESTTARTMERLANDALDRSGRRPATVTINQGELLNVYVARDVDFSRVEAAE